MTRFWAMRPVVIIGLLVVGVVAITANLALGGRLVDLDQAIGAVHYRNWPHLLPFADWLDRIGQRAVGIPLMALVVYAIWRRYGFRRPIVIALVGTLALNFVVGVLKLSTGRDSPRSGNPEFFVGDVLYPSGHAGNVLFGYGLMAAFALRYALVQPRRKPFLVAGVAFLTVLMFALSIYRGTHWFTDLAVGAMLGGIALQCSLFADSQWPWIREQIERLLLAALRVVAPLRYFPPHGERSGDEENENTALRPR